MMRGNIAQAPISQPANPTRVNGTIGSEVDLSATVPVFENVSIAGNISAFLPDAQTGARGTSPSLWGFLGLRCQL